MGTKIETFTDLNAWKEGHKLVLLVYKHLQKFPQLEKFSLVTQMQRCVVSITSNIAEGFSRRSPKEKIQFYYISLGSVSELQNQLIVAKDLSYLSPNIYNEIFNQSIIVSKIINGLIKSLNSHNT